MVELELVYRAVLDLYDRDVNGGNWPAQPGDTDGVPDSFRALARVLYGSREFEGVLIHAPEEWVFMVEQYVRRRATELLAGKIRAEGWVVESEVSSGEIVGSCDEEGEDPWW